jgi:hypothetical protein
MKRHHLILSILFFIKCLQIQAQDTLELSTAIQIGLANNFNIKISKGQKQIAENNNTVGNAGFLPTLQVFYQPLMPQQLKDILLKIPPKHL